MKGLSLIMMLMSVSVYATGFNPRVMENAELGWGKWSTSCSKISVYNPQRGQLQIGMQKELGHPRYADLLETNVLEDDQPSAIEGLQAKVLKVTLIDKDRSVRSGLGGAFETQKMVYGVKVHFTAEEVLGMKIEGCFGRDVKELSAYSICHTTRTRRLQ